MPPFSYFSLSRTKWVVSPMAAYCPIPLCTPPHGFFYSPHTPFSSIIITFWKILTPFFKVVGAWKILSHTIIVNSIVQKRKHALFLIAFAKAWIIVSAEAWSWNSIMTGAVVQESRWSGEIKRCKKKTSWGQTFLNWKCKGCTFSK